MQNKLKVLHLTYDYAEDNKGESTVVIGNFIKAVSKFTDFYILSLKRKINPLKERLEFNNRRIIYHHFGFPFGIFLKSNLTRITNNLLKYFLNMEYDFDFIHSHKLTFEGIIGYQIAKKLNKRFLVSIRQTDFFVLKYRPDLKIIAKAQLRYASRIFIIAPFMKNKLKLVFGDSFFYEIIDKKLILLPNSLDLSIFKPMEIESSGKLITICWLKKEVVKRKNLFALFKAISKIENVELDIIGYGEYEAKVRSWITNLGLNNRVNFLGYVPNEKIPEYLSQSIAFIMPSKSETFGVVYAEALACGTPILYSKNTGFDGFFDGVGVCVNPESVEEIEKGIREIIKNNNKYRQNIIKLIDNGSLKIFSDEVITSTYLKSLKDLNK